MSPGPVDHINKEFTHHSCSFLFIKNNYIYYNPSLPIFTSFMFSSSKNSKHDARFSLICTGNLGFLFLILTCLPDVVRLFSKSVMKRASLRSSERFSTCSVELERGPFSTLFNQFRRVSSCTTRQFSSTLRVISLPSYRTGQIKAKGRSNCRKSFANSATPFFSKYHGRVTRKKNWALAQFH